MPKFPAGTGFIISVKVKGLDTSRRYMRLLGKLLEDQRKPIEDVLDIGRRTMRLQFANEGSYLNSQQWKPLKPATVRERLRKGFRGAHPILRRTGTLARSTFDETSPNHVTRISKRKGSIASVHKVNGHLLIPIMENMGREIYRKDVGGTPQDLEEMKKIYGDWVQKMADGLEKISGRTL